ncbi:MAG: pimeloyl-ACP methyl ester carboxylesterase [Candidatus Paceibacteria bacterium]|jgi:pimeloyl-ACP methyl ester carboxylesterase
MILALLTAVAGFAPQQSVPISRTQPSSVVQTNRSSQRAALGRLLRTGRGSTGLTLGGNFTTGRSAPKARVSATSAPGVFRIQLDDPGTGWQESVLLGVPTVQSTQATPLLVMFHAYDVSEWDCFVHGYDTFEGARSRGWYVLAPLGAHQVNFGIAYSQTNIEYALSLFTDLLPIDPNRIYGAGFSMGGGAMMSYASRHHDPAKPRFAAVTNHTGGVSVALNYWNSPNTSVFDHPLMFGGSPSQFPFKYSQASAADIDASTLQVDSMTSLSANLSHVTVISHYAQNDPRAFLVAATQAIHDWLQLIPGMGASLWSTPENIHHWSTLDEDAALTAMGNVTLRIPREGVHDALADREAWWFHFYVYQDTPDAFTPFRWDMNAQANRLVIDRTQNLKRLVVNTQSIGLNPSVNMEITMGATDGSTEIVTLSGYASKPQQVLRGGVPESHWSWDAGTKTLTLTEANPAARAVWKIRP